MPSVVDEYLRAAHARGFREVRLIHGRGIGVQRAIVQSLLREHPLVGAFVRADAVQCGYCTPGQVVSAAALVAANPQPTREEIRHAMAGNICRCGTYPKIEEAILSWQG